MTALPAATEFTGASVTEAQFKTALTNQREFLAGLLGADGTIPTALLMLGALCNTYVDKAAGYTVVAADRGKILGCTGTFSLTLTAAATLGSGFSFVVKCISGTLTLDPNSSELIDGASTKVLAAGESCVVMCSGSAWHTLGHAPVPTIPTEIAAYVSGKSTLLGKFSGTTTAVTPTLKGSARFPKAGTVTVTMTLVTAPTGGTAYGRIYKNGVAYGTLRSTTNIAGASWDEVLTFNAGDTIQLYIYSNSSGYTTSGWLYVYTGLTTDFVTLSEVL